jgi:hypothetical protein
MSPCFLSRHRLRRFDVSIESIGRRLPVLARLSRLGREDSPSVVRDDCRIVFGQAVDGFHLLGC